MQHNQESSQRSSEKDRIIFGIRPVMEAILAGTDIERIFVQRDLAGPLARELKDLLKEKDIRFNAVPVEKLNRLTRKNHQGVICFPGLVSYAKTEDVVPGLFEEGKVPLLLLLDRVTDVRNFGAICRTAECMGVDAVIISDSGGAMVNADAMKASAGAISRITICRDHNLKLVIHYLSASGLRIIGCTEKSKQPVFKTSFVDPVCIIMGSEENGISSEYLKLCDETCMIPMSGEIASLNVSVASGMILYEAVKQRTAVKS